MCSVACGVTSGVTCEAVLFFPAMQRRNFLQGLFGGITAGGLLLRTEPKAVEALALQPEAPLILQPQPITPAREIGGMLYNEQGEAVCFVTEINYSVERMAVSAFGESQKAYIPTLGRYDIRAVGMPGVHLETHLDRRVSGGVFVNFRNRK